MASHRVWANHFARHFSRRVVYARSLVEARKQADYKRIEGWASGPSLIGTEAMRWPAALGLWSRLTADNEIEYYLGIRDGANEFAKAEVWSFMRERAHEEYHPERHAERTAQRHTDNPFIPTPAARRDREWARKVRTELFLSEALALIEAENWAGLLDYDVTTPYPTDRRGWAVSSSDEISVQDQATATIEYTITGPRWMPAVTKRMSFGSPPLSARAALARVGTEDEVPPIISAKSAGTPAKTKRDGNVMSSLHNITLHPPSSNAALGDVSALPAVLGPSEGKHVATVANTVTSVRFSWRPSDSTARSHLEVRDADGDWGVHNHRNAVPLRVGLNEMRIVIVAENITTTSTNVIEITRAVPTE